LIKQIEQIQEEINKKLQIKEKLEEDIRKAGSKFRDLQTLKDKIDLINEKSKILLKNRKKTKF
jgi:hypothetical protein